MKKTRSLRKQMFFLMALLVALQSTALGLALVFSGVFSKLDAEAFRLFNTTTETRADNFNRGIGELMGNLVGETTRLNEQVAQLAESAGVAVDAIYLDDDLYESLASLGADTVLNMLRNNNITGAYVIWNRSNASKEAPDRHSAIYIRDTAPDYASSDNKSFQMEVGPAFIAKDRQMAMGGSWTLDLRLGEQDLVYHNPCLAVETYPRSEMERYGYWSPPYSLMGDQQYSVSYSLPLIDGDNRPYGVVGFELSLTLLERNYMPSSDLPYQNSFYILARTEEGFIDMDWFIPSGPLARTLLKEGESLPVREMANSVSATEVGGQGRMYVSLQPLRMYSDNSPFVSEGWSLVSFVDNDALHDTSRDVQLMLIGSILITTGLSFLAVVFLTWLATNRIVQLPEYIRSYNPTQEIAFEKTGLREIDELTNAIEVLNRSVLNSAKTTSKFMELTAIPMGGYEVTEGGDYVVLTGFLYDLLQIPPDQPVTGEQWASIHSRLVAEPSGEYENVYRYAISGRDEVLWLRIQQAPTDSGYVGTVLDVTEDTERSLQLSRELDFDALTQLYSRKAFKREVHSRIVASPGKIGAMIFADLDNLKFINDTYGHDVGDRLISRAGEMFTYMVGDEGIVSRISGDEFAAYLHGYDSKEEVLAKIYTEYEKIKTYELDTPDGKTQRIRFSAGVAVYPDDSDNVTDLLKLSDFAMYEAKHQQKGSLFEFNHQSYQEKAYLLDNREAINRLIDESLIRFALQPIVDLATGEVFGYEALMRPLLQNFSSPLEILTVAASQSKLSQLERMVLFAALDFVMDNKEALAGKRVFVNSISNQQFTEDDITLLETQYKEIIHSIVIEITEEQDSSIEMLEHKAKVLKNLGFQLAIDDFGSGYSNELRILSLNPDIIKIDMGIIQGIHDNPDKQQLVANILNFCKPRGVRVIAEGVEHQQDARQVHSMEVDLIQGFFTGRPAYEPVDISPDIRDFIRQLNKQPQYVSANEKEKGKGKRLPYS